MSRQKKKILLVGNYAADRSESMNRYAEMLERVLAERGYAVRLITPPRIFGKLIRDGAGPAKWLGYLDKYLAFPRRLMKDAAWADIVHISDQGNASYARLLRRHVTVITCHDMFAIRAGLGTIPDHSLKYTGRVLQESNRKGLETADAVVCVSDYTKEELLRFTTCDPARVRVAHNPLNYPYAPAARKEINSTLAHLGADPEEPYFLHVGGNFAYKNRAGVARIFSELRKIAPYRDAKLLMAGARWSPELRESIARLKLDDAMLEVETPSNEQLRALYSGALALIFPSFYEGFGWPLVEAQACGCPVATSSRRPMSDIVGDSGILFDPLDERGAALRIAGGLADRRGMSKRGLDNVARFSPAAMFAELEATYELAGARRRDQSADR